MTLIVVFKLLSLVTLNLLDTGRRGTYYFYGKRLFFSVEHLFFIVFLFMILKQKKDSSSIHYY